MTERTAPILLAGSPLGEFRHVCAFFESPTDEYRVLLPFIKDGLDAGDKAVHVIDPARRDEHVRRLAEANIDVEAAQATGQLEVRSNTETYLRGGRFDSDRMLEAFEQLAGGDRVHGFARSRIVCWMNWVDDSRTPVDDVIEFESRVNAVWRRHDDLVICTYHLAQFGGDAVVEIMRTHPIAIVGGTLQRNPFFVPPEQFMAGRRAHQRPGVPERHSPP